MNVAVPSRSSGWRAGVASPAAATQWTSMIANRTSRVWTGGAMRWNGSKFMDRDFAQDKGNVISKLGDGLARPVQGEESSQSLIRADSHDCTFAFAVTLAEQSVPVLGAHPTR